MRNITRIALAILSIVVASSPAFAERVIIKCAGSCDPVVTAVQAAGGTVTHRYKYVKAIAADVPTAGLSAVRKVAGPASVRKDLMVVTELSAMDRRAGTSLLASAEAEAVGSLTAEALADTVTARPQAYLINNATTGVDVIHARGFFGQNSVVAVLDSGIRPGFPHLTLDNSVIGGENFVPDGNGFSHINNNGHGTFVAGMISANVVFNFAAHPWRAAIANECPQCITPEGLFTVFGSAPLASIYAIRVLNTQGSGAQSWILAGMERVIDLRVAYDAGQTPVPNPDGSFNALPIRVANMSLGGTTLFPGRDIEDEMTKAFLDHDILLVVAAGNQGPGGATIGSPGSGVSSLTVGASSSAVHERILRNIQFGVVGAGALYRPFDGTMMAEFSSRGPTADGRVAPHIVANGFASFGAGTGAPGSVSISAGTSFAAPTVAGIAAVLREAVPNATARQVYNALIASADPTVLADGSGPVDHGAGYVNAAAAYQLLRNWTSIPDTAPGYGVENKNVNVNFLQGAGVKTWSGNVTRTVTNLMPGGRFETFYKITPNTSAIVVTVSNFTPGATQNPLFGDDLTLTVHSAKTSAIGADGDYKVYTFTTGGTFTINNPDLGIMRIALMGSTTNASSVSATVNIRSITDSNPGQTSHGKIADGETVAVPFRVPVGASRLDVRLEWDGDWSNYPVNDLDVILQRPDGTFVMSAATLNAPELATIANPPAGNWIAYVDGFTVSTKNGDKYKLRIAIDGVVVK
jgi:hypothetical protein